MIIRIDKTSNYTVISNDVLQDSGLSFSARGVLCYLLSKPDNWRVKMAELTKNGCCSMHKIKKAMKELRDAGYASIEPVPVYDEHGGFTGKFKGTEYVIRERPKD